VQCRCEAGALSLPWRYPKKSRFYGTELFFTRAMVKITYVQHNGMSQTVEAQAGMTVMEAAVKNMVPGIDADCGGACACATCHVYVEGEWFEKTGGPSPMEEDMLDFGYDVRPNSRLSCQIKVSDALDGLTVRTPERQG
jgi:ferredoxin, 2Fe-2S